MTNTYKFTPMQTIYVYRLSIQYTYVHDRTIVVQVGWYLYQLFITFDF